MSNSNLKIIFNKFDKNHSNTLDLDEFNDFLKSYNKETISKDDYDKLCAEVDIDSDKKTLDFDELKKVLNHLRSEPDSNADKVPNNVKQSIIAQTKPVADQVKEIEKKY